MGGASSFGPALFLGLTAMALITHKDPTPPLPNPAEVMEFASAGALVIPSEVPQLEFVQTPFSVPITARASAISLPRNEGSFIVTKEAAALDFPTPAATSLVPRQPQVTVSTSLRFTPPAFATSPIRAAPMSALNPAMAADGLMATRPSLFWATVSGNAVHLRTGPGTGFESLAQFNVGARAIVTERMGDWMRINVIEADGGPITGWMFAGYLASD